MMIGRSATSEQEVTYSFDLKMDSRAERFKVIIPATFLQRMRIRHDIGDIAQICGLPKERDALSLMLKRKFFLEQTYGVSAADCSVQNCGITLDVLTIHTPEGMFPAPEHRRYAIAIKCSAEEDFRGKIPDGRGVVLRELKEHIVGYAAARPEEARARRGHELYD